MSDNEEAKPPAKEDPLWAHSPVREFLCECFDDGRIPMEYSVTIGPRAVYDRICDEPVMKGTEYGEEFRRRLKDLQVIILGTVDRAVNDKVAFDNFMANHPRPTHNHKGEPRWEGSKAEEYLKEDMANGRHEGLLPAEFRALRPEYQEHLLATIRGHIDQEKRLHNYRNYLEQKEEKDKKKKEKAIAKATKATTKTKPKKKD